MSNKGIFIRQYMGQKPGDTSTSWSNSPDILVYGVNQPDDPSVFIDPSGYNWYFSQPPKVAAANYVFVRGLNAVGGLQNSRVYLYYVETDLLLDPKNWKASSFNVGAARNYVDLSSQAQWEIVTNATTIIWTPPALTSKTAHYCLIGWSDSSGNAAPDFAALPPFANLDALGSYVQAHANMAFLDTQYAGLFVRQFPGQTANREGTGAQSSPDIILTGNQALQNAGGLTTDAAYSSGTISQTAVLQQHNFVYVRALNTIDGSETARAYVYWAYTTQLSPPSWNSTGFTVAGQQQNWVDLAAQAKNQILISTVPLVWRVDTAPSGSQYVLIVYVDGSADPEPPDFSPFGYVDPGTIAQFVATQPRIAWLSVNGTTAARPSMSAEFPLVGGPTQSQQYVGVQLQNIPTDGKFSLSIPGPDSADTIVVSSINVPEPHAAVVWPVTYPPNFHNSMVLNYWQGTAAPPQDANILPLVLKKP